MTLPLLNQARQIVFLITGEEKARTVQTVLEDRKIRLPAQKIRLLNGRLTWLLDGSAVSWTDFVTPVASSEAPTLTLQPAIPERDPDLATFAQVDLEACGISPLDEYNARLLDSVHTKGWVEPTPKSIYNLVVIGAGDVASKYQFTHTADFMARLVIRNALFFGRDKFSSLLIPWATYTDPEVAHVGLYENDLQERNIEFATFRREFSE